MKLEVIAVIDGHLGVLERQGDRLLAAQDSPASRLRFDEFAKGLGGLQRAIDQLLLPVMKEHAWRHVSSEFLQKHVELKYRLGELLVLRVTSADHPAALRDVVGRLREQRVLAAKHLFPWLREALDYQQRWELGWQVHKHLTDIIGEPDRDFNDSEPVESLFEQAKLVLSSFPAARATGEG